jgi:hypothetical protein
MARPWVGVSIERESPSQTATIACGSTGEIRDDVTPEDLLRALIGMCYMHDQPGWQVSVLRLVDVFIDGLSARPNGPRAKAKRKKTR